MVTKQELTNQELIDLFKKANILGFKYINVMDIIYHTSEQDVISTSSHSLPIGYSTINTLLMSKKISSCNINLC